MMWLDAREQLAATSGSSRLRVTVCF